MGAEDERFDTVVVGSGFGGAVTAFRLAEAGRSVLVLERGKPYPPGSFARAPHQMRENFWDPEAGLFGLFDLWSFRSLDMVLASGLGGGSLIYANVMLRKDERTFVHEDVLDGGYESWPVSRADLEPHYDRVEAMQRPQRYPLGHEPYASTPKTLAMLQAANELDLFCELPPLAILFGNEGEDPEPDRPVAEDVPNLHNRPRSTCCLCAECDLGCNTGSKNTLDFTYLSAAKHAGATLRTCCEARTITPRADGAYEVGYEQHLEARDGHDSALLDDDADRRHRTVITRRVILAAGALGSPRLLLMNRAALPGLSPQLGRRVSANGDGIAWVRDATRLDDDGKRVPRYLDPSRGPVITASIEVPAEKSSSGREFHVQDAGAPPLADWMWQALEAPGDVWRARRMLVRRLVHRLRGRRDTNLGGVVSALLGTTRTSAAMLPLLGMGRDVPNGRYRLRGDTLDLDWSSGPSDAYYDGLHEGFHRLARALGGKCVDDPLDRLNKGITVHPVGGAPMGTEYRLGVVDPWGQVFGYPGLYVADGSTLPGAVGPNPSFTIAAFADRVADGILEPRAAPPGR